MPLDSSSSPFAAGELKPELDAAAGSVKGGPVDDLENAGHGAHAPQVPSEGDAAQSTQSAPIKGLGAADLDHAGQGAGSGPKGETDDLARAGTGADAGEKALTHTVAADHHDIDHGAEGAKADTHFAFDHHDDPLHAHLDGGAGDHLDLHAGEVHDKGLVHDDAVKGLPHEGDHHDHAHGAHGSTHDLFDDPHH